MPGEKLLMKAVETWYLHHNHRTRCDHSRTVQLDNADHYWLDDIRRAWFDALVGGEPLHLTVVTPTPPRADSQQCVAHVLLPQGFQPATIGVVFTARFLEDHQTQLIQEAMSSPDWISGNRAVALSIDDGSHNLVAHFLILLRLNLWIMELSS